MLNIIYCPRYRICDSCMCTLKLEEYSPSSENWFALYRQNHFIAYVVYVRHSELKKFGYICPLISQCNYLDTDPYDGRVLGRK